MKYQMFVLAHHNGGCMCGITGPVAKRSLIPLKIQSRCLINTIRTEVIHKYVLLYIERRKKIMSWK